MTNTYDPDAEIVRLRGQVERLATDLNAANKQLALLTDELNAARNVAATSHERIAELLFELTETMP